MSRPFPTYPPASASSLSTLSFRFHFHRHMTELLVDSPAPAQANLREAQSYAGGSGSERKELKGRKQRLEGRLGKGDSSAPTDVLSGCGRGAHLTSRRRCPGAGDCERRCSVLNGFFAGGCRAVQSLQFRQPLSYLTRVFGMRS